MGDQYIFKVLVLGDSGVGKTTLINKYVNGQFIEDTKSTIGVQFLYKTIELRNSTVKLQIWDFEGQERFRPFIPRYFHGSLGIILIYSLIDRKSYDNFFKWYDLINEHTDKVPILLIGSKLDLVNQTLTTQYELEEIVTKPRIKSYLEVSSKTGENVEKLFTTVSQYMMDFANEDIFDDDVFVSDSVPVSDGVLIHVSDGNGVPISDDNSVPVSDGNGVPVSDGNGVPVSDGNGVPVSDGNGVPVSDKISNRTDSIIDTSGECKKIKKTGIWQKIKKIILKHV